MHQVLTSDSDLQSSGDGFRYSDVVHYLYTTSELIPPALCAVLRDLLCWLTFSGAWISERGAVDGRGHHMVEIIDIKNIGCILD